MELRTDVVEFLKEQKRVMLSFSGGKDSLVAWCLLKEVGIEVWPFYMQMIPGLSFVEEYLDYLEEHFSQSILRVQHPQTYQWLRTYAGQTPHRKGALDLLNLPRFSYRDVEEGVRRTLGLGPLWCAVGTRVADSPIRRHWLKKLGWKRPKEHKFYPIAELLKADLIGVLQRHQVLLAPCYTMYARSLDGVDYRFIDGIRQDYPADYALIKQWMPLQDTEFHRVAFAQKHGLAVVT